jgi:hypothetical protein
MIILNPSSAGVTAAPSRGGLGHFLSGQHGRRQHGRRQHGGTRGERPRVRPERGVARVLHVQREQQTATAIDIR